MAKGGQGIWARFIRSPIRRIGLVALVVAVVFGFLGYRSLEDFLANASTELVSIALTVLVIDYLNEQRAEQQLKAQLIREMGSDYKGTASRAIRELDAHGWLKDGSLRGEWFFEANFAGIRFPMTDLQGANLISSDLENAILVSVNLQGALMAEANLRNAVVKDEQLAQVASLWGATMQDGRRYDGRFNLPTDLDLTRERGVDPNDLRAMAEEYGISLEAYQQGQEWAKKNLPRLRGEAAPGEQADQ